MTAFSSKSEKQEKPRTAKSKSLGLQVEALEDRLLLASRVIPGTELFGPDFTDLVPPQPDGAVGGFVTDGQQNLVLDGNGQPFQYLVSVVQDRIAWVRTNDTAGIQDPPSHREFLLDDFFANNVVEVGGRPIDEGTNGIMLGDADGDGVLEWDDDPHITAVNGQLNFQQVSASINPGAIPATMQVIDARVMYDQFENRFVVAGLDTVGGGSTNLRIAVSRTNNPNDGWIMLSAAIEQSINVRGIPDNGSAFMNHYFEDLRIGLTQDALIFTANAYAVGTFDAATDGRLWTMNKQLFYQPGNPGVDGFFTALTVDGTRLSEVSYFVAPDGNRFLIPGLPTGQNLHLIPTHNYGEDNNAAFVIDFAPPGEKLEIPTDPPTVVVIDPTVFDDVRVFRIDATNQQFPGPISFTDINTGITTRGFVPPETATAPHDNGSVEVELQFAYGDGFSGTVAFGNNGPIDIGHPLFDGSVSPTSAVWRDNAASQTAGPSIWTSNTVGIDTDNDVFNLGDQAFVRWYEITANPVGLLAPSVAVRQQGGVDADFLDPTPGANPHVDTYMSNVMVDQFNNMAISFTASNEDLFIGAYYADRFEADFILNDPRFQDPNIPGDFITRQVQTLHAGEDVYRRQLGDSTRLALRNVLWGPYNGLALDPTDGVSFWNFNAYAATRPQGNLFGFWMTTWGKFTTVADARIFVIDVSETMNAIHGQDSNLDGVIGSQDDRNNDQINGSMIDNVIFEIERLHAQGLLPGQNGVPGTVGLVIFGRNAAPVEVDLTAANGTTLLVDPNADNNNNLIPDIIDAVRSVKEGEAGFISTTTVDPTRTFYQPALDALAIFQGVASVVNASFYSDGSGRLLDPSNPMIPANVRVDTTVVGPFFQVGDISQYLSISTAAGGSSPILNLIGGVNAGDLGFAQVGDPQVTFGGFFVMAEGSRARKPEDVLPLNIQNPLPLRAQVFDSGDPDSEVVAPPEDNNRARLTSDGEFLVVDDLDQFFTDI